MEPLLLLHGLPSQNPDGKSETCAKNQRHELLMDKLKDSIYANLMGSKHPSGTLTREAKAYIENKLRGMFQTFDTPTHPPYALMIRKAIIELDEEGGSSEESISGFIEREYEGLPCGHVAFLSHHLRRLCKSGEIVCKNDGLYMIGFEDVEEIGQRRNIGQSMQQNELKEEAAKKIHLIEQKVEDCLAQRQELEAIDDCNKVKEMQIVVSEEQHWHAVGKQEVEEQGETLRLGTEAAEQQIEVPYLTHGSSVELNDKEQNCPQSQLLEVTEESSHLQKLQIVVHEDYSLVSGQQNRAIEEQNILQGQQTEFMNERRIEGQLVNIPSASETLGECLDCNVSSYSLKEQQQRLTKSSCTDVVSNLEVSKGKKQSLEQEDRLIGGESRSLELQNQVESELFRLYGLNGHGVSKNSLAGEYPLLAVTEYFKESLKQVHLQQQAKIIHGDWKHIVVHGLTETCDKLKTPKSQWLSWSRTRRPHRPKLEADATKNALLLLNHRHDICQLDADTIANASLLSDHHRDIEKQDHQLEDQQKAPKSCLENEQPHGSRSSSRKPHKPKLDADTTTSFALLLSSDRQEYCEQKLYYEPVDQLKTSKEDGNGDCPSHTSKSTTEPCDKLKISKSHLFKKQQQLSWSRTRRHGIPKQGADTTTNALLPSGYQHDIDQLDAHTTANALLLSDHHHDIEQKQYHQLDGQARPSKAEGSGDQQKAPESRLKNKRPHGSRSRASKSCRSKLDADTIMSFVLALPSDRQQDLEQRLHHEPVGQLRPSKTEGNGDKQKVPKSYPENEQPLRSWIRARKRHRPKLHADTTMSFILALPPDQQKDCKHMLHHESVGQLKPSKAEGNGDQQKAPEPCLEKEQPRRSRSRDRKFCRTKLDIDITTSSILTMPSNQQKDCEQKLHYELVGQLKPSKAEGNGDQQKAPKSHLDNEQPCQTRSRSRKPCRPKLDPDTNMSSMLALPSDRQQDHELKLHHEPVGQLKTSVAEGNGDQQKAPEPQLENEQPCRSRSRARKSHRPKLDAETTMSLTLALPSDCPQDHEQKLHNKPVRQLKPYKAEVYGDQEKAPESHRENEQPCQSSRARKSRRPNLDSNTSCSFAWPTDHPQDREQTLHNEPVGQLKPYKAEGNEGQEKAPESHLENEQQPRRSRSRARKSRWPKLDADTTTSSTLALPSDRQEDCEQKLHHEPVGQLKPSKSEGNGDQQEVPMSQLENEQPHRSRSRARKPHRPELDANIAMSFILALPSDRQQDREQKLHLRSVGQLKPSKTKGNGDQERAFHSHLENEQPRRSRSEARKPHRPKLYADTSFMLSLPSDRQQDLEQKLHHEPVCQLKPSKAEGNGDQQKAPESCLETEQPHRSRSGARKPCRPKLDADTTTSSRLTLPSDGQEDREQELQHQPDGQSRPSDPEGNEDQHRSLRIYVRRKFRQ